MALSGSIGWSSGGTYNSWGVLVTWSAKQNIAGNYSDVTASVSIRSTNSGSWFQRDTDIWLSINGNSDHKIFGNLLLNPNSTVSNVYSRTVRVPHDPGGGKSFALSASMSNATVGTVSVSGGGDLTGIPRESSMTWDSSTFPHTFGKATAMNVTSAVGSYYHSVEFRLNGTLIGAPLMNSQGGGRKEFTIPIDWASRLPDSTIANCSFRLITYTKPGSYSADSLIGFKDYDGQVSVPDSMQPTISSVTYTDQNATVKDVTGSDQILVQGKSIPQMSVMASSVYGATIKTWTFEWGGQSYTNNGSKYNIDLSQIPNLQGNQTVKVTVTDTRGRTATMNDTLDIRAYAPPTITKLTADRLADPTTTISLVKTVSVSSIKNGTTEKNSYTVVTRYKKSSETAWLTAKTETNTSDNFTMTGFAVDSSYDIEVAITDRFSSYASKVTVSTIKTLMDFYRDIGVGIAKMYESGHGVLDVGGDIDLNGNVLQKGSIWSDSLPAGDTATKEYWFTFPQGRSAWWYGNDSNVKNTPSSWGFVEVMKAGKGNSDFSVLWYTQASGNIYRTSGNANSISGWNSLIQSVQPYYLFNTTRAVAKPWGVISFPWQNTTVQGNSLSVDSTDNTKINVYESGWYELYISGTITGATAGKWYDLGIMQAFDTSGTKYDGQEWVQKYAKRGHYYPPSDKEFVIAQTFTVRLEAGYCNVGVNGDDSTGTLSNIWCTFKRIADKNW